MSGRSSSGRGAMRFSALLVVAGALLSGPGGMALVAAVAPQPAWSGVAAFAASYHPVQALPYVLGFLLLAGFVLFIGACHSLAGSRLRPRSASAMVFTAVYAAQVFTNYTLQAGYVPRMVKARPEYLAALTMANPASFAWFLEMFGYAALGVATWLVAPGFKGSPRARLIRGVLVANGVVSIAGAAFTALFDGFVFSAAGLVAFAAWNLLIVFAFGLIAASPAAWEGGHGEHEADRSAAARA